MSTEIDNKVVEMRFDNQNFEENVQTSLSTLDKLKAALNFKGVEKSFASVEQASERVSFDGFSSAVNSVSLQFNALEVAAVTALGNITNSALNAGKQLLSSLTVDNIAAGWQKFGDKTTSVGTLISQGYDIETVTRELAKLNWYTDETSYNFTDMVANIAKFTSTGQDLQTSVKAMEGIANWAALSGQNATVASRAMYNISQAMGAGSMKLIDYKSIQNASMDTSEFRQKVLDAAVELKTLKKVADDVYETMEGKQFSKSQFTSYLATGWFDKDVMMKVFNEYSSVVDQLYDYTNETGMQTSEAMVEMGDSLDEFGLKAFKAAQEARTFTDVISAVKDAVSTGWMNTFENIFGNYEEAKTFWTDLAEYLYDIFAEGGNARNELLEEWNILGGRQTLIDSFWNSLDALKNIIDLVKESFKEVFPEMTVNRLLKLTVGVKDLTASLKFNDVISENVKRTLRGVFSVIELGINTIKAFLKGLLPIFNNLAPLGDDILSVTASLGDFLFQFNRAAEAMGIFDIITAKVTGVVMVLTNFIKNLVKYNIADFFKGFNKSGNIITGVLTAIMGNIGNFIQMILSLVTTITGVDLSGFAATVANGMNNAFTAVYTNFDNVINFIKSFVKKASELLSQIPFGKIFTGISNTLGGGIKSIISSIQNLGASLTDNSPLGRIGRAVVDFVSSIANADSIAGAAKIVVEKIRQAVNWLVDGFGSPQFRTLCVMIQTGILIYIANQIYSFVKAFVGIKVPWLGEFLSGLTSVLSQANNNLMSKTVLNIAQSMMMLAASIYALSTLDAEKLGTALAGLGIAFHLLMVSFRRIEKVITVKGAKHLSKMAAVIISFSVSLVLLTYSLDKLSKLSFAEMVKGLTGVFALMWGLTKSMGSINNLSRKLLTIARALIPMAVALNMLVIPVIAIGNMRWDKALTGTLAVIALLHGLAVAAANIDGVKQSIMTASKSMILMGVAINTLVAPVIAIGLLPYYDVIQGVLAVAALLAGLVTAARFLDPMNSSIVKTAASLILLGVAIDVLTVSVMALASFAAINWGAMWQGLGAVALALAAMVGAAVVLSKFSGDILAAAGGIAILAVALTVLLVPITALTILATLNWEGMWKGLAAVGAALLGLVVAAMMLKGLLNTASWQLPAVALGVAILAASLNLLVVPIEALGHLEMDKAIQAVLGITIALFAMVGAIAALNKVGVKALVAAAELAIVSKALERVGIVVAVLGQLDLKAAAIGVGALAASLLVIILALFLASDPKGITGAMTLVAAASAIVKLVTAIAGLIVAVTGLITTLISLKGAVSSLSASIALLGAAIMAGILAVTKYLADHMQEFLDSLYIVVDGIVDLTIYATYKLTEVIVGFISALVAGILMGLAVMLEPICDALLIMLIALLNVIRDFIRPLADTLLYALEQVLLALIDFIPILTKIVVDLVIALCDSLADELLNEETGRRLYDALNRLFDGLNRFIIGFFGADTTLYDLGCQEIYDFFNGAQSVVGEAFTKFFFGNEGFGTYFVRGCETIGDAFAAFFTNVKRGWESIGDALSGFFNLVKKGWETIGDALSGFFANVKRGWESIGDALSGFFDLVKKGWETIGDALKELASNDVVRTILRFLSPGLNASDFIGFAENMSNGLSVGLERARPNIKKSVKGWAQGIEDTFCDFFGIHSPAEKFIEWARNCIEGFKKGIDDNGDMANDSMTGLGNGMLDMLSRFVGGLGDLGKESGWSFFTSFFDGYQKAMEAYGPVWATTMQHQFGMDYALAQGDQAHANMKAHPDTMTHEEMLALRRRTNLERAEARQQTANGANTQLDTEGTLTEDESELKKKLQADLDAIDVLYNLGQINEEEYHRRRLAVLENYKGEWDKTTSGWLKSERDWFNKQNEQETQAATKSQSTKSKEQEDLEAHFEELETLYNLGSLTEEQYHRERLIALENYKGEWDKTTSNWLKSEREWCKEHNVTTNEYADAMYASVKAAKEQLDSLYEAFTESFDKLLEDYQNGLITLEEYDKRYRKLVLESAAVGYRAREYADDKVSDYVSSLFDPINDEFEKKLADIQSKIDSYSDSMRGTIKDAFEIKTNRDIYDETVDSYNQKITELEEKRDKAIEIYGENHWYVKQIQSQIDDINKESEKYQKEYADSGVKDDDIASINFTDKLAEDAKALEEYNNSLSKLMSRGIMPDLKEMVAGMSIDEGKAFVEYLNGLSDAELQNIQDQWDKKKEESEKLASTLYQDDVDAAIAKYETDITNLVNSLPPEMHAAGMEAMKELGAGFSEASHETLEKFGQTMFDIKTEIMSMATDEWVKTFATQIAEASQGALDSMGDLTMKIKPVLDLSEIDDELKRLKTAVDDMSTSEDAAYHISGQYLMQSQEPPEWWEKSRQSTDNSIYTLGQKVDTGFEHVIGAINDADVQVVLDSNAVSGMANRIIGKLVISKTRGS